MDLKKAHISQIKSFSSPPAKVKTIGAATVYVLHGEKNKIHTIEWKTITSFWSKPDFLNLLKTFDPAKFPKEKLAVLENYMKTNQLDSKESVNATKAVSLAAAGMHGWLVMLIEEAKKEK